MTTDWLETNRGAVARWEVDHNGHLTVAYYFERFGHATFAMLDAFGLGLAYAERERRACVTVDGYVRYARELGVGDILHIATGVIDADAAGLTLGHKLFNSETGAVCATFEQRLLHVALADRTPVDLTATQRRDAEARRVLWDVPARERRPPPRGTEGFRDTARDSVDPRDLDPLGETGMAFYIHRFSAANGHAIAAFGMTPSYMRDEHRGFSTFEFQLTFAGRVRAGDTVSVKTGLLHVGSSSIRLFHSMTNERSGERVATLEQLGVHLDMDARRPTPLPDALRDKARALLAPTG